MGKKSVKRSLHSNLVTLISNNEHVDVNYLNYSEQAKEDDGKCSPLGDCL